MIGAAAGQVAKLGVRQRALVAKPAATTAVSAAAPGVLKPALAVSAAIPARPGVPQGVDLNLGKFDLSSPMNSVDLYACCAEVDSLEGQATLGSAFWEGLKSGFGDVFEDKHTQLLKSIFNPNLSDRASEGKLFTPPDSRINYVNRLQGLVKDEESHTRSRLAAFQGINFKMESPGDLFPASWTSGFEISRRKKGDKLVRDLEVGSLQPGMLVPRPDYGAQATAWEHMLKTSTPIFDKTTEDGRRFRIYRSGTIEVRTVQAHDEEEKTLCAFTIRAPTARKKKELPLSEDEKLVKVTQFVERNPLDTSSLSDKFMPNRCYYVVAQTDAGNTIVTEKLKDGTVTFQENPKDLDDRNSLAKTVRSKSHQFSTTVADLKICQAKLLSKSETSCKKYAYNVYDLILGKQEDTTSCLTAPPRIVQKSVREQFVMLSPMSDKTNAALLMKANSRQVPVVNRHNDAFNKRLLQQASNSPVLVR